MGALTPDAPTSESTHKPREVQHSAPPGSVSPAVAAKEEAEGVPTPTSAGPTTACVQDSTVSGPHEVREGSLYQQRESAVQSILQKLREQFARNQAETAHLSSAAVADIAKSPTGAASQPSGEE